MIVRNEAGNLPACLSSVHGLFDEIVIVDTGSADRTREVASDLGARVCDFPWSDSFSAARNESLRLARGDWIFWMDADDRVDRAHRARLESLFSQLENENIAYEMTCLCRAPDGGATRATHVRLFRNKPGLRWHYRVHEQIGPALRRQNVEVRPADIVIEHIGYQDPELWRHKQERNLRLLKLSVDEEGDDPYLLFHLGWTYHGLGQWQQATPVLSRCLERAAHSARFVARNHALLASCYSKLGQQERAWAICQQGLGRYPDHLELLYCAGQLCYEAGDWPGAAAAWLRLLEKRPMDSPAFCDDGLSGYRTRHSLAVLYDQAGRAAEAEAEWRRCLAEEPAFVPALWELGRLLLRQARWTEVDRIAAQLDRVAQRFAVQLRVLDQLAREEVGGLLLPLAT
ncbi:MAG: glycosyltransferase [Gemmataceae bacterium]